MKPAFEVRQRGSKLSGCEICGFTYPNTTTTCAACGRILVELPSTACLQCGVTLEPGEDICGDCDRKQIKDQIRPMVEAAVISDKRLSRAEKELIIRIASDNGVLREMTEALLSELLKELGAIDEEYAPVLKVEPTAIRFPAMEKGARQEQSFVIKNIGAGAMTGKVVSKTPWLEVTPAIINSKSKEQNVTVGVSTDSLPQGATEKGLIQVKSTGGDVDLEVYVEVKALANDTIQQKAASRARHDSPPRPPSIEQEKSDKPQEITGKEKKSSKSGYIITAVLALVLIFILIAAFNKMSGPVNEALTKLNAGQLVTPIGNSAYDLWLEMRSTNPNSSALTEISTKALPLLKSKGDLIMRRWHDEGRATDQEWNELSRAYEWAAQIEPSDKHLLALKNYCLGQVAFREKRFDDALKDYQQALQYEKNMSLAYNGIGRVHANRKNYNGAEENYKKAIECEPQWCYPYANLGGVYLLTNNYPMAESYYKQGISRAQNKPSIHYQLAQLYEAWKRHCDTLEEYRKAIELAPNDPEPGFAVERVQKRISQLEAKCL